MGWDPFFGLDPGVRTKNVFLLVQILEMYLETVLLLESGFGLTHHHYQKGAKRSNMWHMNIICSTSDLNTNILLLDYKD